MFQLERQEKLLKYINEHKKASVNQLADLFDVAKVTIRRDIQLFSERGLVIKTHGGVLSPSSTLAYEIPFSSKSAANKDAKKKIGQTAAKLVDEQDMIILDAGSTALEVVRSITAKCVTILTHDINIAMESTRRDNASLILAGGCLDKSVQTLTGSQTADFYRQVHVNKTFLGCDALDLAFGISNRSMEEVAIKRAIIAAADEVILITDHTKLNKKVFFYVCAVAAVQKIVIDRIDDQERLRLEDLGVTVLLAE